MIPQTLSINDYNYDLPGDRIALRPLAERDASKLLLYKKGVIEETVFSKIDEHLPAETLLVFNNTKVINARIKFTKPTGAVIEIFCLEPYGNITEYSTVMNAKATTQWKCMVGGAAKWKEDILQKEITIGAHKIQLYAEKIQKITEAFIIEFSWVPAGYSFSEIIEAAGIVPLPPYIKRAADDEDNSNYQTIFARHNGSVAAPTAGLHFTQNVLEKLASKNIQKTFVTLHVGAGTFKPVKAATMQEHEMHAEYIDVDIATIQNLQNSIGNIAAVGTTSLRTIETLYWFGVKVFDNKNIKTLSLHQWDVYEVEMQNSKCTAQQALAALLGWMKENNMQRIFTQTQILIAPGYTFKIANILITNFHQPKSTLLLLIAAGMGNDWKKMYDYALQNDFRFLSFGDANLIWL